MLAMLDANAYMELQLAQVTGAVAGLAEEQTAEAALQFDVSECATCSTPPRSCCPMCTSALMHGWTHQRPAPQSCVVLSRRAQDSDVHWLQLQFPVPKDERYLQGYAL